MSETLIQGLFDFFWLVIPAVAVGLLLLLFGLLLSANVTWAQKRLKFLGVFYNLNAREQMRLSVGMVRVLFVIMVMFFGVAMKVDHIALYLALFVIASVLSFTPRRFLMDVLNTAIIGVALVVANLLAGYYKDVSGDMMIWWVRMLLALFVTMYAAYFYIKDICDMLENKKDKVQATHFEAEIEEIGNEGSID